VRVAVFLNIRFYRHAGSYSADEQYFKFWLRLADRFDHFTLCVPVEEDSKKGRHPVEFDQSRVSICPLPMYTSSLNLYLNFPYIALISARRCADAIRKADLFIGVIPNLLGLWLGRFSQMNGTPPMFYVRGNLEKTVRYEYTGNANSTLPILLARFLDRLARRAMKRFPTFVVGKELYYKYLAHGIHTIPIITTLINDCDLVPFVPKKNLQGEVRLLTVGRLSPERGIDTLLDAMRSLNHKTGVRFTCTIIGDGPSMMDLKEKAYRLDLKNVVFKGYIPYGSEMIENYRNADIFVLPSHTEGFPKVILEAMANGCPVVSTRVGGIPYTLRSEYDSILISPHDPVALAVAVERLVKDQDLYNRIGLNAYHTIQELTYERQSEIFFRNVNDYIQED
jgi:glycosyltransferase involved in cell wall biosynthesis